MRRKSSGRWKENRMVRTQEAGRISRERGINRPSVWNLGHWTMLGVEGVPRERETLRGIGTLEGGKRTTRGWKGMGRKCTKGCGGKKLERKKEGGNLNGWKVVWGDIMRKGSKGAS